MIDAGHVKSGQIKMTDELRVSRRVIQRLGGAAFAGILGLAAGTAHAQYMDEGHGFYAGAEAGAGYIALPEMTYRGEVGGPVLKAEDDDLAPSARVFVGYENADMDLPAFFGVRPNIEFGVTFMSGSLEENGVAVNGGLPLITITGQGIGTAGIAGNMHDSRRFWIADGDLSVSATNQISDSIALEPLAKLWFRHAEDNYTNYLTTNPGGPAGRVTYNEERLITDSFGIGAGIGAKMGVFDGFSVGLGMDVGGGMNVARFVGAFDPNSRLRQGPISSHDIDDNDISPIFRSTGRITVDYRVGRMNFGIVGEGQYLENVPYIDNPKNFGERAKIGHDRIFAGAVRARVSVLF